MRAFNQVELPPAPGPVIPGIGAMRAAVEEGVGKSNAPMDSVEVELLAHALCRDLSRAMPEDPGAQPHRAAPVLALTIEQRFHVRDEAERVIARIRKALVRRATAPIPLEHLQSCVVLRLTTEWVIHAQCMDEEAAGNAAPSALRQQGAGVSTGITH